MIVHKTFRAKCPSCSGTLTLREYKGWKGSRYGEAHICLLMDLILEDDPDADLFFDLEEVKDELDRVRG